MEIFGGGSQDINNLSTLLHDSALSQEKIANRNNQPPTNVEPTKIVTHKAGVIAAVSKPSKSKNDIWDTDEIPSEDAIAGCRDARPSPKYEISYYQSVGSEDTFLGLSDKTPLSSDCTHLIVKVYFPGCTMHDLDLDVTTNRVRASSKTLMLMTYLPVNVHDKKGSAKFDTQRGMLTITLPIDKE
jgi:hypothetical protein